MLGLSFMSVSRFCLLAGAALSLVGLCYALYAIGMTWYVVLRPLRTGAPSSNTDKLLKIAVPLGGKLAIFILAFALGYQARKIQQYDHTNHMQNVDVIRRYDGHHYKILSEDIGQSYDIQLCNDVPPDWQEGMILSDFVYEQTSACQRLDWYKQSREIRTGKLIESKEATP